MAIDTITYSNKSFINENVGVADTNKIKDTDMNEIKRVVNETVTQVNENTTDISNSQTYAITETLTGETWIDNKPIYRRVFDYGQLPNNSSVGVTHNIPIDTPIKCFGIVYRASSPVNSWTTPTANIFIDLDKSQVYATTTSDRRDLTCKAILEYTKTTD